MNTGILSLPEGQYRAAEGISKSSLDWIAPPRTPAHYKAKCDGLIKDEQTPAMRLGSMIHRAILEWDSLDYVVKPAGMNFATKEGKEWKAAQTNAIITADEYQTILGMRDSVNAHPAVKRVLANARTEVSLFANGEDGVLRKARIDALPESGNVHRGHQVLPVRGPRPHGEVCGGLPLRCPSGLLSGHLQTAGHRQVGVLVCLRREVAALRGRCLRARPRRD
jgi:hypothetical protein